MRRHISYDPDRDFYVILGIDASATDEDIRQAYRRAVREVHPDLNPDRQEWATSQLQIVNEAYTVLSDHSLRRDYDRARWPHVPLQQARTRAGGPFGAPTYDPNRPWWEQVSPAATHGASFSSTASLRYRSRRRRRVVESDPFWLTVSDWLKKRNLTRLNTVWLSAVGLWRSPFAGILSVLGVVLAIDVALIVFVLITPHNWDDVENWITRRLEGPPSTAPPIEPTAPADRLSFACDDPTMQITTPRMGDTVSEPFAVIGTVQHPELWTYSLAVGFIGQTASSTIFPAEWVTVRTPPANQSIPELAITDDVLTGTAIDLTERPAGFYALRLRVELRNGEILHPCDIVVRYQHR
jgi:hypothetical protein